MDDVPSSPRRLNCPEVIAADEALMAIYDEVWPAFTDEIVTRELWVFYVGIALAELGAARYANAADASHQTIYRLFSESVLRASSRVVAERADAQFEAERRRSADA